MRFSPKRYYYIVYNIKHILEKNKSKCVFFAKRGDFNGMKRYARRVAEMNFASWENGISSGG